MSSHKSLPDDADVGQIGLRQKSTIDHIRSQRERTTIYRVALIGPDSRNMSHSHSIVEPQTEHISTIRETPGGVDVAEHSSSSQQLFYSQRLALKGVFQR